jgi:hypothetical protein
MKNSKVSNSGVERQLVEDLLLLKVNLEENIYKIENIISSMALILENYDLYTGTLSIEGYSNIRVVLDAQSLRIPYEIKEKNTKVYGIIIKGYEKTNYSNNPMINIPVIDAVFLLTPASLGSDSLYISKETWHKLREYGILPDKAYITIIISDIEINGTKVKVYSQRDVKL